MVSLAVALRASAILALALFCSPLSVADEKAQTGATVSEIKTLLRLNGSDNIASSLGRVIGKGVLAELRRANPALPERADALVSDTVETYIREQSSHGEVIDLLVPIYAKYLTKSDVEGLIAFYRSPVGRKLATVTPAISSDSTLAGQQWATSIAGGLQLRLGEVLRSEKLIQ